MRYLILILALLFAVGCSTTGPGQDCDSCAVAETDTVPGGNAAAAAASGGQRSNQAPFSGESGFTPETTTAVGRGAGDTSLNKNSADQRHTSSGGAQNLALLVPTEANANAGGGTSASVVSAQRVVDSYIAALQLAFAQGADPEQIKFISEQLSKSQEALAKAEAGTRANVTNNYNMGGDNTIVGYSRAGTGVGKDDPRALEVLNDAAKATLSKPSSKPSAGKTGDAPEPPAGPAGDPINGGGD